MPVPFITSHSNDERRQPAQTPRMSGFDKSFKNLLTAQVGTLVPVLCDPVIAGSRVNLGDALVAKMPPLASDTFMNCDIKLEAFYVPASSLYGGFNDFITKRDVLVQYAAQTGGRPSANPEYSKAVIPFIPGNLLFGTDYAGPGTLADYLGFKSLDMLSDDATPRLNPLPFLAYHRIYDRYYRNSLVQKPIFSRFSHWPVSSGTSGTKTYQLSVDNMPYLTFTQKDGTPMIYGSTMDTVGNIPYVNYSFSDGKTIFDLRQRNFDADYFTTATPTAQKGDPSAIEFKVDTLSGLGSVSIAAVRAANALQIWGERNNMTDDNIHSYNVAHYGVHSTGFGECMPRYLGQHIVNVYSKGVTQSAQADGESANPFNSVGAEYGRMEASGQGSLINSFEAPEYGYIMVLGSLVPRVSYSTGVRRHLLELVGAGGVTDIPDAILQGVGPQEVFQYELDANSLGSRGSDEDPYPIFGYQQRYAHYMDMLDEVHGLFRDGQSLQAFAAQRTIRGVAQISSDFLEIPTNYLDQVAAVKGSISEFGYWMHIYFDYKVSMPIAAYSIPTLENPAGDVEWIRKPGYSL